jgi:hypothetical protein
MDTLIHLRPEELTEDFYKQLQNLSSAADKIEIKISGANAVNGLPDDEIQHRLKQVEENKTISFTMEEFKEYIHQLAD